MKEKMNSTKISKTSCFLFAYKVDFFVFLFGQSKNLNIKWKHSITELLTYFV